MNRDRAGHAELVSIRTPFRHSLPVLAASLMIFACAQTNHLLDAAPVNPDLTIHVVIENPAGSNEKWEVRADGRMLRERRGDDTLSIAYLPWPVNGGMVPRTLLSRELGGDGEPLDVIVLGPAIERGSLVRATPIGLLRTVERLERDDKIIAVVPNTPFAQIRDVGELEARFPGVREILATWYAYSHPDGVTRVEGYGSRAAASRLIAECVEVFDAALRNGTLPEWETR